MDEGTRSSRLRFQEYRQSLRKRRNGDHERSDENADAPTRRLGRLHSTSQLLTSFWTLLRPQRLVILGALATLTLSTLLGLAPPAATKVVVDYVLGDQLIPADAPFAGWLPRDKWSLLVCLTLGVAAISFIKVGLHIWGRWEATRATKRLQMSIRRRLFEHAVRLPLRRVHELKSGGMASLLREDAGSIGNLIFGLLYNPWRAIVQLLGSLCVLALVDWRLLLGALAILPAVYFSHRTWIHEIRPRFKDIRARRQGIDSATTETFAGIRVVRAFSRQRTEALRIISNHHLMGRQELYVWWWMRAIELFWALLIPVASAGLMLYGGWQVLDGQLTVGDLMMFLVYLLMLLEPLAILAESAAGLQDSLSALDRVLDVLGEEREMQSPPHALRVSTATVAGRITFEHVGFEYTPDSTWSLRDIDLEVKPGEMVALVGPSGAGKTTLCNLVARFYDPTHGRVLLDGRDLRDIDVESYRGLLGVVEQDVFLFDGTVSENLAYAHQEASPDDILRAAQISNSDTFIRELPQGYDTLIGERGVKLSGGQRQRLAIGRAILADPRILILDEATSNLDSESESLIQQSLASLLQGRTSFVIAHRLSTIRHADRILVLEGGRVIESGTHAELLATGGRYQQMVALQTAVHHDHDPITPKTEVGEREKARSRR
jgi:ATP-binding cassette subfamily B protein